MILQYRGFNNNWIFEESKSIGYTKINLNDFLGIPENRKTEDGIEGIKNTIEKIEKIIISETGTEAHIVYYVGNTNFIDLELISVVMLIGVTYVINSEAYLLNDLGKTIVKIF